MRSRAIRSLVTGASGLLGSALARRLLALGHDVWVLSRDASPDTGLWHEVDCQRPLARRVHIVHGDLEDYQSALRAVVESEPNYVWHAAAMTQVTEARMAPLMAVRSNVLGTANLLEALRSVRDTRGVASPDAILVASSDKVYGRPERDGACSESTRPAPQHIYDASKLAAETIALAYRHHYGMPIAVSRMANLYGPGDTNWRRLIPGALLHAALVQAAATDRPFLLRSPGLAVREYLYVGDAVDGWMRLSRYAAWSTGRAGGHAIVNLGSGDRMDALTVLGHIREVTGVDMRHEVVGTASDESDWLGLDSSLAYSELGWRAVTAFRDGLAHTWRWVRQWLEATE